MKVYEYYEQMQLLCNVKAKNAKDSNIKKFYENAAIGFSLKKEKLSLDSANEDHF